MFSDLESLWDRKIASHLDDGSLSGELSELKILISISVANSVHGLFRVTGFVGNPGSRVLLCGRIPALVEIIGVAVRPRVIGLVMRRVMAVGGVVVPGVVVVLCGLNASSEEGEGEKCRFHFNVFITI